MQPITSDCCSTPLSVLSCLLQVAPLKHRTSFKPTIYLRLMGHDSFALLLSSICSEFVCLHHQSSPSPLGLVTFDCTSLGSFNHTLKPLLGSCLLASPSVEHFPIQWPVGIWLHLASTLGVTLGTLSGLEPVKRSTSTHCVQDWTQKVHVCNIKHN